MQPVTQMTLEALRSVPLFASLDDDAARLVPLREARLLREGRDAVEVREPVEAEAGGETVSEKDDSRTGIAS